jgi:hypothetical protein
MSAIVGRLIRQQMRDVDTPERAAERIAHRQACEQANREMMAKFGPLTAANAAEAIAWQQARISELRAALAKGGDHV